MLTALRIAAALPILTAAGGLVATVGILACGMRRPRPQQTDDFARWAVEMWGPSVLLGEVRGR